MKKQLLILSIFVLILSSCKKKEFPKNVVTEPTFYVSALVDGTPVNVKAGLFDYYMYSSYTQDSDGLYTFVADVKPGTCSNACPNSLKIELNDNKTSPIGGSSNISNSIKAGVYNFVNTSTVVPSIIGYQVYFKSSFNKNPPNDYQWTYGDNTPSVPSIDPDPVHIYTTTPGIYNIRVGISEATTSTLTFIENPIKVTISQAACKTRILASNTTSNTIAFTHSTTGSGNYSFYWNFGDGYSSTSPAPVHTYSYAPGRWLSNLRVIDNDNHDTAYHNYIVNTDLNVLPSPNFYASAVVPIYSNNLLSKVKITYTDGNGVVYSSNLQSQSGSSFSIISVEDYIVNENQQSTKKLKINFSCKLYNGSSMVNLTNGEAVIAVSYK